MKNFIFTLLAIISLQSIFAQEVKQNILVEHYTNTRCSICASKNPALFSLLEDYDDIHLAYYPSKPYNNCIFSLHNASEADGRTRYYDIFGSTPRVVLNGEVIAPSTVILQESRIEAEVPNTTPFIIEATQEYIDADSVSVTIKISTVAMTTFSNLNLQVMLAENLIDYAAPNGEDQHPNVFRKALYGINGKSFTVPANGSDITLETTYSFDPDWKLADLEIIAFIQDNTDKTVKQATVSARLGTYGNGPTAINTINHKNINIFPNPTTDILNIVGLSQNSNVAVYNLIGEKVIETTIQNNTLNIQNLQQGIYFLELFEEGKRFIHKINKK